MIESVWVVLKAALLPINMPFTVALVVILLYWMLVIVGALDFDTGHDVHLDMDGHVGGDAHGGHDIDGSHDGGHEGTGSHSITGFQAALHYLHIGDTPTMVVISVMSLLAWVFAILLNVYLNPSNSLFLAAAYLVPNAVLTTISAHYVLKPVSKLMRKLNDDGDKAPPMIGLVGEVTTSEVTPKFGMALMQVKGAPLSVQIRSNKGELIKKGDQVLVIDEDRKNNTFEVVKYKQTELEE